MNSRVSAIIVLTFLVSFAGCMGTSDVGNQVAPTTPTPTPTGSAPTPADGALSVHFIHVGQGHSVLVVGPTGETMLVDSGNWDDDGEYVIDYLEQLGVDRIDYLVSSHADADHIGGHAEVIEHFETQSDGIGAVYDPGIAASTQTYQDYLDAIERHEVPLYKTLAGDTIPLAGANVDVLSPPDSYLAGDDRNENSLVIRVAYGTTSFMLPGDAERRAEEYVVGSSESHVSADVLQAGHHGSSSSSGDAFLDAVRPRIAVIASASDSRYGHPHEETLARFAARSIRTYWTAVHGTVVVRSDGESLTIATQRDAATDPRLLYGEPPIEPASSLPVKSRVTLSGNTVISPETVVADGGTKQPTATAALAVAMVQADAPGNDRENPNGEYVVFENEGDESLDLGGWTVADEANHVYTFSSGASLAPGEKMTLYSGSGTDGDGEYFWDAGGPIWNNDGDTITVRDENGRIVLEVTYP